MTDSTPATAAQRHDDGVFREDGTWCAYDGGNLIACGPNRAIIQAAYDHRASADEFIRGEPNDA